MCECMYNALVAAPQTSRITVAEWFGELDGCGVLRARAAHSRVAPAYELFGCRNRSFLQLHSLHEFASTPRHHEAQASEGMLIRSRRQLFRTDVMSRHTKSFFTSTSSTSASVNPTRSCSTRTSSKMPTSSRSIWSRDSRNSLGEKSNP